jgi:hypothetical protein
MPSVARVSELLSSSIISGGTANKVKIETFKNKTETSFSPA